MDIIKYEHRVFLNPKMPIAFQFNGLGRNKEILMHWHENIEILNFREGETLIGYNTDTIQAREGDLVVINTCALHSFRSATQSCLYECITISKKFLEDSGLPVNEVRFNRLLNDADARRRCDTIKQEILDKSEYYEFSVKAEAISLITRLLRIAAQPFDPLEDCSNSKMNLVKSALLFIQQHFTDPITVDDICKNVGFSKYYFCRTFHEITGKTVIQTINDLRCGYARELLTSKKYNISECARICGFSNFSYFSKTYKRHIGELPSMTIK